MAPNWVKSVVKRNRFLNLGIPFFILVIGGSFGLEKLARVRYDYRKQHVLTPEEAAKHGISMKQPGEVSMESEFAKMKEIDIDNWENIRGPRPWEEPTEASKKQMELKNKNTIIL